MLEWSWRIEKSKSILAGSFSAEGKWSKALSALVGSAVTRAEVFGSLPEVRVFLTNGLAVASFMTAEGQPAWSLIKHASGQALHVQRGRLVLQAT